MMTTTNRKTTAQTKPVRTRRTPAAVRARARAAVDGAGRACLRWRVMVVALGGHRSTIASDRQQGWQSLPRTSVALRS